MGDQAVGRRRSNRGTHSGLVLAEIALPEVTRGAQGLQVVHSSGPSGRPRDNMIDVKLNADIAAPRRPAISATETITPHDQEAETQARSYHAKIVKKLHISNYAPGLFEHELWHAAQVATAGRLLSIGACSAPLLHALLHGIDLPVTVPAPPARRDE